MNAAEIRNIIETDGSLFNARYYKDADSIVNHLNGHHHATPPVTREQVEAVLEPLKIHAGTGELMD